MIHDKIIIVAAGSGSRMNSPVPKQFISLAGRPVVMLTMEKFHHYNAEMEIILVLNSEYVGYWKDLCSTHQFTIPHRIVHGGEERFFSVKNAVDTIGGEDLIVGIHDAVRPFVSLKTIESCYTIAREHCSAIPVIHANETLRFVSENESRTVDRTQFRIVQTPQCFEISLLRKAFAQPFSKNFTDDAVVVESLGEKIFLVEGNRENIKLTTPEDLRMAEAMIAPRN